MRKTNTNNHKTTQHQQQQQQNGGPPLLLSLLCLICVGLVYHSMDGFTTSVQSVRGNKGHPSATTTTKAMDVSTTNENGDMVVNFSSFDDDLIPRKTQFDINIGTNISPFPDAGRHRILVDPLFYVCDENAKLTTNVTAFCFAVSDYTGFATFFEYNTNTGVSSSLSQVSSGTSHEKLQVLRKRTVLVLEATVLLSAIANKDSTIHRLKLDMQGHELKFFRNTFELFKNTNLVTHIKAECFCPNAENGKQIYQVDNSCDTVGHLLQDAGYTAKWGCEASAWGEFKNEWGDVYAYKNGMASRFLTDQEWGF